MADDLHHRPEDPWQVTTITAAAEDGDHTLVLRLLCSDPGCVNHVDEFGRCALYIYANGAEEHDDSEDSEDEDEPEPLDMVSALLAVSGVDVNRATRDGETPLWAASARGNTDIAALLLAHGAAVDRPSAQGHTSLWVAVQNGNTSIVRLLLGPAGGADVNLAEDGGCTPLQVACDRTVRTRARAAHDLIRGLIDRERHEMEAIDMTDIVRWLVRAGARPVVPNLAPDARNQPERILRPTLADLTALLRVAVPNCYPCDDRFAPAVRQALAPLADLLTAVRAAGGWVPLVREPRVRMLLLARACARGSATVDPEAALASLCTFLFVRAPDGVLALILRYWWGGE